MATVPPDYSWRTLSAVCPRPANLWGQRSSQAGPRRLAQLLRFRQKFFKAAIQRLIALRFWVVAHANGQDVGIAGFFWSEIELQPFYVVLLELQTPRGNRLRGGQRKQAFLILEVFIAMHQFHPFALVVFGNRGAR